MINLASTVHTSIFGTLFDYSTEEITLVRNKSEINCT